jgi:hypothetical protein
MPSGGSRTLLGMATVTLRRSDLFPVGTTVGIYPAQSQRGGQPGGGPPTSAAIASAAVDAAGLLTVTNAGILSYTDYVAYAQVSGEHRYARLRSTLDFTTTGRRWGRGTRRAAARRSRASVASAGAFAIGQRITGPGIPPGTYLISGSGGSWTMSDKATATATGVALAAEGASPAVGGWPFGRCGGGAGAGASVEVAVAGGAAA